MRLGRVIGRVTLNVRDPGYAGGTLLIVQPFGRADFASPAAARGAGGPNLVAFDELGAGEGAVVGFTEGAEAAQPFYHDTPVDAYVACLVDSFSYQRPNSLS